ncbi:MAG: hypothetical protein HC789_22525 [Microcoleus sp. CSU_2_2]|nr:hypothetical protein [Microcoleus sp. CSU_2_2]
MRESTEAQAFWELGGDRSLLRTDARVARNRVFCENYALLPEDSALFPVSLSLVRQSSHGWLKTRFLWF